MCHLANEPDLASEMYSLASEQFMTARDTTAYYYALNDMAFELAEQKRKEETLAILGHIENQCTDSNVIHWLSITKATMYLHCEQYDSALFHANRALSYFPNEHTCMLAKAQSFSLLGIKDSAVVYAGQVMDLSSSMKEKYNALFVLAYDNPDISYDEMCELTQLRADIGALLENQSTNLTSAIIQIKQDKDNRHRFPVLVLWAFAALMALLILFTVMRRHIIRKNIVTYNLLKRQNKIIAKTNSVLSEQNEQLKQQQILHNKAQIKQLENTCTIMRQCQDIKTQLCWNDYGQMCRVINKQFSLLADRLGQIDGIHETDIRLCVLVLIGFSLETIADILPCSPNSVTTLKRRTALKLGTNSRDLRMFLLKMAANMPV
jgi:DNA-binding CsgD family transcriptional regulator/tetratricopeptide (TPR) repeat protein